MTMGFSRQEYWSGQPFLSPGSLPDPRIKTLSPASPVLAGRFFTVWATRETQYILLIENAVNRRIERTKFVTASPLKATIVAAAKSLQSCPTLCDLIPGILQARTLEWVAISFSNKHFKQASLVFSKLLLQNQPVFLRSLRIPMSGTLHLKSNFATPGNNWQCVESFWSSFVSLSSLFCSTDKSIYSCASTTFS